MDCEEKYNAALERASKLKVQNPFDTVEQMVEHIFPELKENENEKIRKDILCYFEHYAHDIKGADEQKWIAWLKNQKTEEVKEVVFRPAIGCDIDLAVRQAIEKQRVSGKDIVLAFNGAYIPVSGKTADDVVNEYYSWIKNQGEQTNPYSGISFEYNGHTWGMCVRDNGVDILLDKQLFKHLEQQGEQTQVELNQSKTTSDQELEPKFKVKDWVVSNSNGEVWQIGVRYTEEGQRIYLYNVNDVIMSITLDELNNDYHLWTIRDAKDGDVLASKDEIEILIFRNLDTSTSFSSYYNITGRGDFGWSNICFIPATKEQRNLLFEKMKEKGYKWDNEKKELNKIEQNAVSNIEPKFHPGDWVIDNVGNTYQIESATEIESEHIFGYTIVGRGYFNDNNDVRLWSIDDAKRGDVLVDVYGNIGIFDKCYDFDWMSCCSLGNNGGFQHFTVEHENEKTHPATKEQRDLLFEKMKEADYAWDGEKKELKKIEPKALNSNKVIEWLRQNTCAACFDEPDEGVSQRIDKFKTDFEL